jgi:salicylate hydroxylase
MMAYRIDLHATLLDLARGEEGEGIPVEIVPSARVAEFDGDNGTMILESGKRIMADLIIAADGVKSNAAKHIMGEACPELESSTTLVYRWTIPTDRVLADAETAPLHMRKGITAFYVPANRERWLMRYGCRDDEIQNFAMYTLRTHEDADRQEHELRFRTDRESLRKEMTGFHPYIVKLADMASEVLPLWRCTTREPLPRFHRRRLVAIGDAAHPVHPHIGLGALSSIEDAKALLALFEDFPQCDNQKDKNSEVERRLAIFSQMRKNRLAVYKLYSDLPFFHATADEQREAALKYMSADELPSKSPTTCEPVKSSKAED